MLLIDTEIRKTSINRLKALSDKTVEIKKQFRDVKERVKAEISTRQEAIQEQEKVVAETYESFVLDIVSLEDFKAEQDALKELQETLQAVQDKLKSLDAVQAKKIDTEVFQEMKAVAVPARKEKDKIFAEKADAILKAKAEYLKLVADSASVLIQVEECTSVAFKKAEIDAGHQELLYTPGNTEPTFRKLTFNDTYSGGNPVITISEQEIRTVYKV
ncbi:hypothetical protein B481_0130 [Planococcus halocryophilus Or1]|uniref:Uncharacterized protein n=1 Tax=Planococcus halocryophilus TaxID=1215089 RepID=A0A1C7DLT6_9BACL|nr:hypothetical protein [Planococcus halocryophilus]ANU12549.1 hypothetical protein BBI08_01170 [Planococcus halocryophilus]EMF48295.1 hypothetical protein B481_0130 [Planococcus halocryophilus Or1]